MTERNWKLKLRYGKKKTPFSHYTIITPVRITEYIEDFKSGPGTAYLGVKIWATTTDEAIELVQNIGQQTGYEIIGKIEVYDTDPLEPPGDNPYAYGFNFSYYSS
ncbi:hypothetical protein INP83_18170 [Mucilaginibacter sp. 21P]|uniref:hypothetical protein n=1 Tax=Mucilaginibacter sp. 21P TaxID=2778902 RepID=UPI001C569029|nr:hypothetical protein [Mucilaginibacter sp. 21P]QXV64986.1 hypothetical protein INP83_18170 [Mucilaginibacter sp. 21P]